MARKPVQLTRRDIWAPRAAVLLGQAARHTKGQPEEMQAGLALAKEIKAKMHSHLNTTCLMVMAMLIEQVLNESISQEADGNPPGPDPAS